MIDKETIISMNCDLRNLVSVAQEIFTLLDKVATGADLVIVIGNTGAGKSTLLSSLIYGPDKLEVKKKVKISQKKYGKKVQTVKNTIKWIDLKEEFDAKDGDFKIGNHALKSETFMPHFYQDEFGIMYTDIAGLLDTAFKPSISILNSFILLHLFKIANSCRFILAASYEQFLNGKGSYLRKLCESFQSMCLDQIDMQFVDSVQPLITRCDPQHADILDIDELRQDINKILMEQINANNECDETMDTERRLTQITDRMPTLASERDEYADQQLQLGQFYNSLAYKFEYYDPLDRDIIAKDQEENQAIRTQQLRQRISELKPQKCKDFRYPTNIQLDENIREVYDDTRDKVIAISQRHVKQAKNEGHFYNGDLTQDQEYLQIVNDMEFMNENNLYEVSKELMEEIESLIPQLKNKIEFSKGHKALSKPQKKAMELIEKAQDNMQNRQFKELIANLVALIDSYPTLKEVTAQQQQQNLSLSLVYNVDTFVQLIQRYINVMVSDLYTKDRVGFYTLAYNLRKMDLDNVYTKEILHDCEQIPTILIDIIQSNYWKKHSEECFIDATFALQLKLSGDFYLQYDFKKTQQSGKKKINVHPILQQESTDSGYSDLFVFELRPQGLVLRTKNGDLTLQEQTNLALSRKIEQEKLKMDMTKYSFQTGSSEEYWDLVGKDGHMHADTKQFHIQQVKTGHPARLVAKDQKLKRAYSEIMSTTRDLRGYNNYLINLWTIQHQKVVMLFVKQDAVNKML